MNYEQTIKRDEIVIPKDLFDIDLNIGAMILYSLILSEALFNKNNVCTTYNAELAKMMNRNIHSVISNLLVLEEANLIRREGEGVNRRIIILNNDHLKLKKLTINE